jgi:hypothetical protein
MVKPITREFADHLRTCVGLSPDLLQLLLDLKQQIEEDTVMIDHLTGWCRSLPRLIEQDAMPKAWDALVAYLKEHGHAL